jgi:hypothetical protein
LRTSEGGDEWVAFGSIPAAHTTGEWNLSAERYDAAGQRTFVVDRRPGKTVLMK